MKALKHGFMLLLLALAATSMIACGASREYLNVDGAELLGGTQPGDYNAKILEAEAAFALRLDKAELQKAIDTWEAAIPIETPGATADERREMVYNVYIALSRAYYFKADAHVRFEKADLGEDAWEIEMEKTYDKGIEYAERAMYVYSPDYQKAVTQMETPREEAISALDKGAVPAMYWYATNLGKWALLKGLGEALGQVDAIKAMMDYALEQDPEYYHYGPYRYFGGYYTKLPFPGGDLEQSKEFFDKAVEAAPYYLATRVLYAELWAVKEDDEDVYKTQLQMVLDADLSTLPAELLPENTIEQKKAKILMGQIDDNF